MRRIRDSDHYRSELQGAHRGRGVAMGYWRNNGLETSAYASVNADGAVSLVVGTVDIGGLRATHAMQLAEALGIGYGDIRVRVADTGAVGRSSVTGGSRSAFAGGWAMHELARDLRAQLEARAARIWECDPAAVRFGDDGVVRGPAGEDGGERSLAFRELAARLPSTGGLIQARASVRPRQRRARLRRARPPTWRWIRRRARWTSCATPPCRTSVPRSTPRTSRDRCRAARSRASAWR